MHIRNWLVVLTMAAALTGAAREAWTMETELIWIEAEQAVARQVSADAWSEAVDTEELSGGAWLAHVADPGAPAGWAEYRIEVPRATTGRLWLRANPRGTGYTYRLGDGPEQAIDLDALREAQPARLIGEIPVARNAEHDDRLLAWLDLGPVELEAGTHTLRLTLGGPEGDQRRFGAVDAIVLAGDDWRPRGKFRPGQDWDNLVQFSPEQTWPFRPDADTFSPDALMDLRSLNEAVAGEHGFIRLSEDGNSFVRGDGEPIRFWGGSTYVQRNSHEAPDGMEQVRHHARFLAKRGVNIVRYHAQVPARRPGAAITDVNDRTIDEIHRMVAAMKEEGIYTTVSTFWAPHTPFDPTWGIADPTTGNISALVFFDPDVQNAYKAWMRELYTRPNPYTGVPLKDEPAIAMIMLQNEDSMLFWTMQRIRGQQLLNLRGLFGQWVADRYGSLAGALEAWEGYAHDDDDLENDLPGMFIVWEFTDLARQQKGGAPGREQRLADQLEFMTYTMHGFNAEIARFLREELGAPQLINAGNWRTVDPALVDDAERFSYTANEVIGKNHYYGGQHKGLNVGWQIREGHYFTNPSATQNPTRLPVNVKQPQGHPFLIGESLWVPPIRYQAEGPLMVAAQSSLIGMGPFFWFATGEPEWRPVGNKWTFSTPMHQGQFPAAALLYRQGYVRQGEPVVVEHRSLDDIWFRRRPIITEGTAYDPNRDAGDMPENAPVRSQVDPMAFLVGPVRVVYGSDASRSQVADLSPYVDRDAQTVRSNTGQIAIDYGVGIYTVDAPKTQAAAGFLGRADAVALSDVTIDASNDYAAITVVPLDDQPIADSRRLLVQVGTVTRPTGWQARPAQFEADGRLIDGFRIVTVGTDPWQIEKIHATLTVRNRQLTRAVLLDINGMAVREVPVTRAGDALSIQLPPETMYLVLEADAR